MQNKHLVDGHSDDIVAFMVHTPHAVRVSTTNAMLHQVAVLKDAAGVALVT